MPIRFLIRPRGLLRLLPPIAAAAALLAAACGQPAPDEGAADTPAAANPAPETPAGAPDRVVLVTIDTLRADHVGAYGNPKALTPTLDGLARDGVRFTTAISPAPLTLPSHTTILSGLEPPAHGVRHNSGFRIPAEVPLLAERMKAAGYPTAAFVGAYVLDHRAGLDRGFDVYDDHVGLQLASSMFSSAERPADQVVDAALAWLEKAGPRFFVWVHFYDPHADYNPPPAFALALPGDPYSGEIAFADSQLGRLLKAVDAIGPADETFVVVTSDHGEGLGDHGEPSHSYGVYDSTQHVPLLMRGAGLPHGGVVKSIVALSDVTPTVLARVGAPPIEGAQGRDLSPLWQGAADPREAAYVETLATQLDMGWSPLLGLRTDQYKYIRAPRPELYDVEADPSESVNLIERDPQVAARLDHELDERLAAAGPVRFAPELDPEARQRLESLGYVVPESVGDTATLGVVGGPNPRDHLAESALLSRASSLASSGHPAEALKLIEEVRDRGKRTQRYRGQIALMVPDAAVARESGRILIELHDAHRGHMIVGNADLLDDRLDDAEREFREAISADSEGIESGPWVGLARVEQRRGRRESAEQYLRRALEVRPDSADARWRLAAMRLESGDEEEAQTLLAGLPAAALEEPAPALALAMAAESRGLDASAIERLQAAYRRHPDSMEVCMLLGDLLVASGRHAEAVGPLEAQLEKRPDAIGLKNDLAWSLAMSGGDLDRALALARDAEAERPDSPAILDTLATVRLRRREVAEALAVADRALARASGTAAAHLHYVRGAALAQLGRASEAREALRRAREALGDSQPDWLHELSGLERELGSTSAAG